MGMDYISTIKCLHELRTHVKTNQGRGVVIQVCKNNFTFLFQSNLELFLLCVYVLFIQLIYLKKIFSFHFLELKTLVFASEIRRRTMAYNVHHLYFQTKPNQVAESRKYNLSEIYTCLEWCKTTPAITEVQFYLGYIISAISFPYCMAICQALFSKVHLHQIYQLF